MTKTLNLLDGFFKDWHNWNAARDSSKRTKEYGERKISVHYHFRVWPCYRGNPQAQEFCARFNRLSGTQLRSDRYSAVNGSQLGPTQPRIDRRDRNGYVFILDVDTDNYPKGGAKRVFPSEVWLRPSDACLLDSFGEVLQMDRNGILENPTASLDREIEELSIEKCGVPMLRDLPQYLVECGTKLMRYFANDHTPLLWGVWQDGFHDQDKFAEASCPIHATLSGIFSGIVLPERISSFLEGFQVLDCPLNLEARAIKRMHEITPGDVPENDKPAWRSGIDSNA